jgi:hypothetical protein
MGLFFTNMHILKSKEFDKGKLKDLIIKYMTDEGFALEESEETSDISVAIYEPADSSWISIATDAFEFDSLEKIRKMVQPFSAVGGNYVITAACYDSDFLQLSLTNIVNNQEGWINIGHPMEVPQLTKTSLSTWKEIVNDFERLKEITSTKHIFAEDVFAEISDLIGMKHEQTILDANYVSVENEDEVCKLFFSAPIGKIELPSFEIPRFNLKPCSIGESDIVCVVNKGGKGKGIGVMFVGDYVENDEITFSDTMLCFKDKGEWNSIPIELKKSKLKSGKTCYVWKDPSFPIPPGVSDIVPPMKRDKMEYEREIGVRFTPYGNPRKVLDIRIILYPLTNRREGQISWYVYKYFGSKHEYIKHQNNYIMNYHTSWSEDELFNPEDYDLD